MSATSQAMLLGSSPNPSVVYQTNVGSTSDLTTYTFTAAAIGTASPNRAVVIVAATVGAALRTISTVTIGGVSASLVKQQTQGFSDTEMWIAAVPTGTTGDIVVTYSAGTLRCGVGVWAVYNLQSMTALTTSGSTASPNSLNLNTTANSIVIAGCGTTSGGTSFSWAGVTERYDADFDITQTGGDATISTPETPRTITATVGAGTLTGVAACFK